MKKIKITEAQIKKAVNEAFSALLKEGEFDRIEHEAGLYLANDYDLYQACEYVVGSLMRKKSRNPDFEPDYNQLMNSSVVAKISRNLCGKMAQADDDFFGIKPRQVKDTVASYIMSEYEEAVGWGKHLEVC